MKIGRVNNIYFSSQYQNQTQYDKNPISKTGEKAKLTKAVFITGLGVGTRLLFELWDNDIIGNKLENKAEEIVNKQNRKVSKNKKMLLSLGAWTGLVTAFIGGFAILYTIFKAPEINYKGNINSFTKNKDMDVYIKGNSAEKEIYTQMNEKAKAANDEEKAKLKEQYLMMQKAKNKVPDFINLDRKKNSNKATK